MKSFPGEKNRGEVFSSIFKFNMERGIFFGNLTVVIPSPGTTKRSIAAPEHPQDFLVKMFRRPSAPGLGEGRLIHAQRVIR